MTPSRNRTNAVWLRAQLCDLLFVSVARRVEPEEWRQAIGDIVNGESWRGPLTR